MVVAAAYDPHKPTGEFKQHYRIKPLKVTARRLRKRQTKSEKLLWLALRNRQLDDLKFLRQHPIGHSIVDFYCHETRLVIEIDGGIHLNADVKDRDKFRQKMIEDYGIRFFRCTANEVESNLEGVLAGILKIVAQTAPLPSISREGKS